MDEQALQNEVMVIDEQMNSLVVKDAESYQIAGEMVINLKSLRKKIVEYWKDTKEKARKTWQDICAKESQMLDPVDQRIKNTNKKVSDYLTEQERLRRVEQARLDKEREDREAAERAKLEKKAEKAEEKGNTEKAEELREKAAEVYVPPSVVQPTVEKTTRMDAGTVSAQGDIDIIVRDPMAVLKGVVAGTVPISVITISESKLKAHAKAFKLKTLDGCDIIERVNAKFRGKKS